MRRLLLAAAVLAALATIVLVWRIQGTGRGDASTARAIADRTEPRPDPALSPQERGFADRGRRSRAAGVAPAADPATWGNAPSGILILLLDEKGDPLPGAALDVRSLRAEGEFDLQGTTDQAGMLATDIDDPRQIEGVGLERELAGDALYARGPFESSPDRPRVVVVRVPRSARVEGVVRDERGGPVAGARVEIEPEPTLGLEPFVGTFSSVKCDAVAGPDGGFVLGLSEGCFALTPDADGYDPGEIALACLLADAPTVVGLTLQGASRELEVEVRAGGQPLETAVLVDAVRAAAPAPGERLLRDPLSVQRGAERRGPSTYAVRISRDGDWSIHVSLAKGFADAKVPISPQDERIVVELRPPAPDPNIVWARGTVSTDGGASLSAEVAIFHGRDLDWASVASADATGRFEIELDSRETEPLFLLARAKGFGTAGVGPIEAAQLPPSFDIVLSPEKVISGTVVGPDGLGLPARVLIHPSSRIFAPLSPPATPSPERFLDALDRSPGAGESPAEEGSFVFRDLSEGWYEIWASAEDRTLGLPPGCRLAKAGERDLRIVLGSGLERSAGLTGVIREAGTARPIAGARVAAGLARGGNWRSADVYSGEDGSYALPGCPLEALSLYVDAPEHAILASEIGPLGPGTHALDIDLPPERTLRLLVLDAFGSPRPGLFVSAADAGGKPISLRDAAGRGGGDDLALTDLAGRVDLHGLPAAQVAVIVGKREDDGGFIANAAYQVPNDAQPDPREFRFDLRVAPVPVQRIVLPR